MTELQLTKAPEVYVHHSVPKYEVLLGIRVDIHKHSIFMNRVNWDH